MSVHYPARRYAYGRQQKEDYSDGAYGFGGESSYGGYGDVTRYEYGEDDDDSDDALVESEDEEEEAENDSESEDEVCSTLDQMSVGQS